MDSLPTEVRIPPGAVLKRIVFEYKDLDAPVRCGFTSCRTAHKTGFVVAFDEDGAERQGIVGHVCGRQYFGANWEEQERAYRRDINAALIRERTKRYMPAANSVAENLDASIARLQWQMHVQQTLERSMNFAMRTVADAVKSANGYLTVPRRGGPRTFKVPGTAFFVMDAPYDEALLLREDIRRFGIYVAGPRANPREIERRLGVIGDVSYRWKKLADWMNAADAAIKPDVVRLLVRLSGNCDYLNVSDDGRRLVVRSCDQLADTPPAWETVIALDGPGTRFPTPLAGPRAMAGLAKSEWLR